MTEHCEPVTRDTVIVRLIANTQKKNRPDNLIQIAHLIRWLEKDLGNLKAVAEAIDLSTDQLWQFLSVERLCPEVRKLVEERKIDLVNVVHYMRDFDAEAQQVIAREVVADRLSAGDIRVLAPLHRSVPHLPVDQLLARVRESRDVKVYVAYFHVPRESKETSALRGRFERIVGQDEIVSFMVEDQIGTLKLTPSGRKKLQRAAKERSMSLRTFVDKILLDNENRS